MWGLELREPLDALVTGQRVQVETTWTTVHGLASERLDEADHIVSGAGLLRVGGRVLDNWRSNASADPGSSKRATRVRDRRRSARLHLARCR
jgi:hypothetical protein